MGILIMKSLKPLAALVGLLVLSGSANAVNVYNDKGTRFDVNGQFRLKTQVTSKDHEMRMRDDGSRIGFFGSHELTNDIKVFGKLEWGSDTQKPTVITNTLTLSCTTALAMSVFLIVIMGKSNLVVLISQLTG